MVRIPDEGDFIERIRAEADRLGSSGDTAPASKESFKAMLEAGIDPEGLAYQTFKALLKALRTLEDTIPQGDVSESVKTLVVALDKTIDLYVDDIEAHLHARAMEEIDKSDLGQRIRGAVKEQVDSGNPKGVLAFGLESDDLSAVAKMLARLGLDELPAGMTMDAGLFDSTTVPDFPPEEDIPNAG